MNPLNWKKIFISGVIFAILAITLAVGVYLVLKPQSQSVTSKAATSCIQKWPADPNTDCGRSTQSPKQGEVNVSLTPNFHWDYGGYPSGSCTRSSGCSNYSATVYLWKGNCPTGQGACGDGNVVATCGLAEKTDSPYTDAPFSCFGLASLQPNTAYTWRPTPRGDNLVHAEQTWNYTFTTGAAVTPPPPPPPPITVSCNQACNGTTLLCPSNLSCDTVSGTCRKSLCSTQTSCVCPSAPTCDSMAMTPTSTVVTANSETRSMTASGTGTDLEYTWNTTGGTLVMPGNEVGSNTVIWTAPANLGTTAQTWTISATVKDSINQVSTVGGCTKTLTYVPAPSTVTCNQTCNTTTLLCPSNLSCDTVSGTCRKSLCSTQTSCVCPPPVIPVGSCQRVLASKDLSTIKIGDTVTFTGYGNLTNPPAGDSIDKINFIILKDGVSVSDTEVNTAVESLGVWKATKDFTVTSAGSYSVRIRVHWLSKNSWLE